jgi:hypothetical protein
MAVWQRAGWPVPFSLSLLTFSLITGGTLGALATWRGRWMSFSRSTAALPKLAWPSRCAAISASCNSDASWTVRMPLPPAKNQGSIYENQTGGKRYFGFVENSPARESN